MRKSVGPAMVALLLAVAGTACDHGDRGPEATPAATPPAANEALRLAQQALNEKAGYRLKVVGHNLVLPQWGGIDGADLEIGTDGPVATGTIDRTGDGRYDVRFVDGQTYFRRETCDHWARVPGGGKDVLRPFLWSETYDLQDANDPQYVQDEDSGVLELRASIGDLGRVAIELDISTFRPVRLVRPPLSYMAEFTWTFSDWGKAPRVEPPSGKIGDQGPGGNPC